MYSAVSKKKSSSSPATKAGRLRRVSTKRLTVLAKRKEEYPLPPPGRKNISISKRVEHS